MAKKYSVRLTPSAERYRRSMSKDGRDALDKLLKSLAKAPYPGGKKTSPQVTHTAYFHSGRGYVEYAVYESHVQISVITIMHTG